MPKISVIIPLYNKEKAVKGTLESLLQQTFQDFEVIIVDDGSTDNSVQVVKEVSDQRIKLFQKENEGVSHTRNKAVAKATASHIAFLDADDLWESNHLEELWTLIQKFPEAGLYCAAYQKKYNEQLTLPFSSALVKKPKNWQGYVDDFFEASLTDCIAWTSAVAMPKGVFEALGGFDTSITHGAGEDTDLWMRVALAYKVAYSNTITATHILDSDNRISNTPTLKRNYINLDKYEVQCKTNPSLKKFLDVNRYSLAMQHKMAGDIQSAKNYMGKLSPQNITRKQKILLYLPGSVLRYLKKKQQEKIARGVYLTPYKS